MERRKAITTAAVASLTLLAGAAGMALSSNIVGAGANDGVGQLSPVGSVTNPSVVTVYVDDLSDPAATVTTLPPVQPTDATALTSSSASGYSDDDEYEDDDDDDEYEDREYEGGEDDD